MKKMWRAASVCLAMVLTLMLAAGTFIACSNGNNKDDDTPKVKVVAKYGSEKEGAVMTFYDDKSFTLAEDSAAKSARALTVTVEGSYRGEPTKAGETVICVREDGKPDIEVKVNADGSSIEFTVGDKAYVLTKNGALSEDDKNPPEEEVPPSNYLEFTTDGTIVMGYKEDKLPKSGIISIPDGVETINGTAFQNCEKITKVTISDSVKTIGHNAFSGCTNLETVIIGDGVETIQLSAFKDCTSLKNVTIGESVTSIASDVFSGCEGYTVTLGKMVNDNRTNANSSLSKSFSGCTDVIIKDGVTRIGRYVFHSGTSIKNVTIPASVTVIAKYAFTGCTGLENITFAEGSKMTTIGELAFSGCTSLESVTIPEGTTTFEASVFSGCTRLASVIFADTVTTIGEKAFENCTGLKNVTFPDSVTSIANGTFDGCEDYTVTLCANLVEGKIYGSEYTSLYDKLKGCTNVIIKDNVTKIGVAKFKELRTLKSVTIGSGVESIEYNAFASCTNLESVIIPASVKTIADRVFFACESLRKVVYTGDVKDWTEISFYHGESNPLQKGAELYLNGSDTPVSELIIPDDVEIIKKYAFYGLSGVTSVTIGSSVETIEGSAFSNCGSLESVTFAVTDGWYSGQRDDPVSSVDVTDPANNVTILNYYSGLYRKTE